VTRLLTVIMTGILLGGFGPDVRASELDIRVDTATEILLDLKRIPENAIPPALLSRAYAVVVIPSVMKGGFIFGGTYGRGIVVARRADGQWSNPLFVQLFQGSVGFQAGLQSTDLVLVFKSQRALDGLSRGKITLGGDASIAAGPVGRQATASTDMNSEIYSYARSRGLFAGVSLQGGALTIDHKGNSAYYQTDVGAARILADTSIPTPPSARRFIETLTAIAPASPGHSSSRTMGQDARRDPDMDIAPPAGVRTYGIDDSAVEGTF
jgi:lipid-binding SYLF domain-containing protein